MFAPRPSPVGREPLSFQGQLARSIEVAQLSSDELQPQTSALRTYRLETGRHREHSILARPAPPLPMLPLSTRGMWGAIEQHSELHIPESRGQALPRPRARALRSDAVVLALLDRRPPKTAIGALW